MFTMSVCPRCGDMSNLAEAGCLYMMAQDGYGNAYHRYFWSGREPPLYTLSLSPVPMYPGRTVGKLMVYQVVLLHA